MPDVLIGSFKAAEAHAGAEQTLATPHVAGRHLQLPRALGFGVVHFQFDRLLHVGLQEVFQQVALFILEAHDSDMDDKQISCWTSKYRKQGCQRFYAGCPIYNLI